jgi:hypothetical protein
MQLLRKTAWTGVQKLKRLMGLFVLTIDRDAVATTYLKGNGIEIGALHNPLKVSEKAQGRYLDQMTVGDLRGEEERIFILRKTSLPLGYPC